jgi:hypothetical protein
MTAPIPEGQDQPSAPLDHPPGEHPSEAPDAGDGGPTSRDQEENAGTSLDEPSDDTGRESEASDE